MISIKESQLDFRIYRIETCAACCKCENETYSGDESGEAEAGLLSAQSAKKKISAKFDENQMLPQLVNYMIKVPLRQRP